MTRSWPEESLVPFHWAYPIPCPNMELPYGL